MSYFQKHFPRSWFSVWKYDYLCLSAQLVSSDCHVLQMLGWVIESINMSMCREINQLVLLYILTGDIKLMALRLRDRDV